MSVGAAGVERAGRAAASVVAAGASERAAAKCAGAEPKRAIAKHAAASFEPEILNIEEPTEEAATKEVAASTSAGSFVFGGEGVSEEARKAAAANSLDHRFAKRVLGVVLGCSGVAPLRQLQGELVVSCRLGWRISSE